MTHEKNIVSLRNFCKLPGEVFFIFFVTYFVILPRGTPEASAIPLISSPNGLGNVSAIKGCRAQHKTIIIQRKITITDLLHKHTSEENDTHQRNVNQFYQPSTGHKSISHVLDGLNHADQLKEEMAFMHGSERRVF